MTEHLPECMTSVVRMNYDCICPELRACEQRMREGWYEVQSETWEQGFRYALNAAREAVAAAHAADSWTFTDDSLALALSAIDALRGES